MARRKRMQENKRKIYTLISIFALLFLALPAVSAHIEITDMGHYKMAQWSGLEGPVGYLEYQNAVNYTVDGAVLVFIDGEIVAGKMITMRTYHIGGVRCAPKRTLEFSLNETEGDHRIVAYIQSMNSSIRRTYDYCVEEAEGVVDEAEMETEYGEEDWLQCSWRCG